MISEELKHKLELAFTNIGDDIQNAIVIGTLQSEDKEDTFYIIAKDPSQELYYGIRENEFVPNIELAGHPMSNLTGCGLREIPNIPFSAIKYINTRTKQL